VGEQIEKLAQFVARTGWDDMPEAVHRRAKLVLLDTIGVTLAGAARPEVIGLSERLLSGAGRGATVLAAGLPQADIRTAALLNGIAARSVELCEGANGLQPSPHILPGVLAIAEQRGLGGRAMLGAFVLGYEVAGRLARAYTQRAFSHPNGQLSLLGAAAAGARLQGLDGAGVSLAMRVATSMLMTPSYNNTVAGGTTLNLPAGLGAVAATLAPEMAAAGYAAQDGVEDAVILCELALPFLGDGVELACALGGDGGETGLLEEGEHGVDDAGTGRVEAAEFLFDGLDELVSVAWLLGDEVE